MRSFDTMTQHRIRYKKGLDETTNLGFDQSSPRHCTPSAQNKEITVAAELVHPGGTGNSKHCLPIHDMHRET